MSACHDCARFELQWDMQYVCFEEDFDAKILRWSTARMSMFTESSRAISLRT